METTNLIKLAEWLNTQTFTVDTSKQRKVPCDNNWSPFGEDPNGEHVITLERKEDSKNERSKLR